MSRAHALAPDSPGPRAIRPSTDAVTRRARRPAAKDTCYVERALLLWPRLERAKLRKIADDPARIAELVVRRTSQPYEAVLAMITRQSPALAPHSEEEMPALAVRAENSRVALRIVRSNEGREIRVQNLLPLG